VFPAPYCIRHQSEDFSFQKTGIDLQLPTGKIFPRSRTAELQVETKSEKTSRCIGLIYFQTQTKLKLVFFFGVE